MAKVTVTQLRKYVAAIKKAREKHLTCEKLASHIGVYPDVISNDLSMFDPLINLDMDYNLRDLLPLIEEYLQKESEERSKNVAPREVVYKKEVKEYESIQDFIYKKMTFSGMIDKNAVLSDKDLKVLKKLIIEEQDRRKKLVGKKTSKKRR